MRGRKPVPTDLRKLHGNPRQKPINKAEPKPVGALDSAPEWMSESQKAGWRYALDHAPAGLLKRLDRGVLTVWVCAEDAHREASQRVTQYGLVTKSPEKGVPIQNPFLAIMNRQAEIMLRSASELGFSPASRPRIWTTHDDGTPIGDDLDALLAERRAIN